MNPSFMIEGLHDAFQMMPTHKSRGRRFVGGFLGKMSVQALRWRRAVLDSQVVVNERIVEYPVIWRWLMDQGRVLDFGCATSRMPLYLANLGYEVHGLDLRPYPWQHSNLSFFQANIFDWQPPHPYDMILCISTLEHVGLGAYEGDIVEERADFKALQRLHDWLAPDGQLLLSVPFGQTTENSMYRVYNHAQLQAVTQSFITKEARYFRRVQDNEWASATVEEMVTVASPQLPVNGVAILKLQKSA